MASQTLARHKSNKTFGTSYTKKDIIFYILILLIPIVQVSIFYFAVNIQSFFMAFQKYDADQGKYLWDISKNLDRFSQEISTKGFWVMLKNSIVVFFGGTFVSLTLAVFFSYYIYKRRTLYNLFKFVLFLPSVLPGVMLTVMFKTFMSEAIPTWMDFLFNIKVGNALENENIRFLVITIYGIWLSFGSQVLVYTGAMDQIPTEIIEAGKLDGVSTLREFFSIIIPCILPTMTTFIVASIAGIFTNQNGLYNFYGSTALPQDRTLGYYLYILVQADGNGKSGYCYASFLGLLCTLFALPITYIVRKLLRKVTD